MGMRPGDEDNLPVHRYGAEKLWKVKIEEHARTYLFYVVSTRAPLLIFESYLGRLRRMFDVTAKRETPPQPVFHIPKEAQAKTEKTNRMHGFNLQKITSRHIVLSAENPEEKDLYEISLIHRKIKGHFKKKYVLAENKKKASQVGKEFKSSYRVKVRKAKKMDCYPVVSVDEKQIILKRTKRRF